MNTRTEILETMIEIVDAIKHYQKWLAENKLSLAEYKQYPLSFKHIEHNIDIQERVLVRLEERYNKHLAKLNKIAQS